MIIFLQILFWLAVFFILHSYLFYPFILSWLGKGRSLDLNHYREGDELPKIYIIMSVFNEEAVLQAKMESIFQSNYPAENIKFIIGSDASTDRTNQILSNLKKKNLL